MPEKLLLQVRDISKSYGEKHLLEQASVSIVEKQKIGVIGRNGAGKTTLFKMILGDEEPDNGEIIKMPNLRLGYIQQHDPFLEGENVIDFLQRYTQKPDWECAKVASQFQLKNARLKDMITDLSGGYQMRVKLTAMLLAEPNLLMLDEPTNYLDLSTLILLEQFLKGFRGAFMVITHDREFLKKTCTSTLDVADGKLFLHPEPLEEYLDFKEEQKQLAASVNLNIERKQKQLQTFVNRFGAKDSMAKSAQSKMKQIQKLDSKKISIGRAFSNVKMYIPPVENKQGTAIESKKLKIGYPDKIVATEINFDVERGKKVAILGDNGQGKSTLLKTIANILKPIDGDLKWKSGLKIAYYAQHVNQAMLPTETIEKYIRRVSSLEVKDDDIYRVLGNFLFKKADYTKPISVLSGGEKARLCMAGMFLSKSDVYLLDEPTNHLDFETVEAMGQALSKFNGTVFVVSHDRTFVNLIASEIFEVKDGSVKRVLGSYEDYVWQLEQDAENNFSSRNESKQSGIVYPSSSAISSSKEINKKLYDMRKQIQKVERKISSLKVKIADSSQDEVYIQELSQQEELWLSLQEQILNLQKRFDKQQ
ncbi:MAG: ABC-F family ATP-binding cassette domain-containing protein [Patescibacteria group bacterium]